MKRRMRRLSLLLAGYLVFSGIWMYETQASQMTAKNPAAGVSRLFADLLAESVEQEQQSKIKEESVLAAALEQEPEKEGELVTTDEGEENSAEAEATVSEYADIAVAQVDNYVNVRMEPNTESEVLGKLYDNSAAKVLEVTEDGWYRIESGTVNGYVKAEYVVVGDEQLAKEVSTRYAKVTTTTLFVRDIPSTEGKVLTMLPEGDDLVVLEEEHEGWVKVSTVEGDGYISTDYVSLSTEYIYAESRQEEEARLAREEEERRAAIAAAEAARAARLAEEEAARQARAEKQAREAQKRAQANAAQSGNANSGNTGNADSNVTGASNGQAVVEYAKQFLGNPYVYGGNSLTNGTDCSGFVKGVYAAFGVSLPRTSAEQRSVGYGVSLENIQPGDIVCYSGHVGIYAGNNTLIHASSEKTGITYTSPVTYRPVLAVRRIF